MKGGARTFVEGNHWLTAKTASSGDRQSSPKNRFSRQAQFHPGSPHLIIDPV
jgi:hypothetical protein